MRPQLFDKLLILAVVTAIISLLAAAPAAADEDTGAKAAAGAEQKPQRTVIKATMHVDVDEVRQVLGLLGVNFAVKPDQNLIVLRGDGYAIDTALKVIDALDVPRPSIDLRVFVLAASKEGKIDVPENLETVANHLRGTFGYKGFKLLDSVMLRVLEGRRGRVDGGIQFGSNASRSPYRFAFEKATVVPEDDGLSIRLKGLEFEVAGKDGSGRASLETDIEIREGQKAVIGSSTPDGLGETLVLIVEAVAAKDPKTESESESGEGG